MPRSPGLKAFTGCMIGGKHGKAWCDVCVLCIREQENKILSITELTLDSVA